MRDAILYNKPPPQRHMYRLLACTAVVFVLLGVVIGMLFESFLDAAGGGLRRWFTDTDGQCEDGLIIPGPAKNHLMMLVVRPPRAATAALPPVWRRPRPTGPGVPGLEARAPPCAAVSTSVRAAYSNGGQRRAVG